MPFVNVTLDEYELTRGDETIYVTVTAEWVEVEFEASGAHAVDPVWRVRCSNCGHAVPLTNEEWQAIDSAVRAAAEEDAEEAARASWEL